VEQLELKLIFPLLLQWEIFRRPLVVLFLLLEGDKTCLVHHPLLAQVHCSMELSLRHLLPQQPILTLKISTKSMKINLKLMACPADQTLLTTKNFSLQ